jgi:4-amino-4-deoxy-L-arabinose transferase-like glycosyltransferase
MAASVETEDRKAQRCKRADSYFDQDLFKQYEWYSERASRFKALAQRLGLLIMGCGVVTAFLPTLRGLLGTTIVDLAVGTLGITVALVQGVQRIWKYDEIWPEYRKASERMKREWRLYVNGAGAYRELADENEAFLRFVEATEQVIAEEQQIYFELRGGETIDKPSHDTAQHQPQQQGTNT